MQTLVGAIVAVALSLIPAPPAEAANFTNPIFAGLAPEIAQDKSQPEPIATPAPEPVPAPAVKWWQDPALQKRLACIRSVESRGRYGAVSPTGKYRGAFQFDLATWRSVGGAGDPAAAIPAEQDYRAALLLRERGTGPWPPARHC